MGNSDESHFKSSIERTARTKICFGTYRTMKLTQVLTVILLMVACQSGDNCTCVKQETISVALTDSTQVKLWKFDDFLDLSGVDCDFYADFTKNQKSYKELMTKMEQRKWQFEFISMELDSCMNDSIFRKFRELNEDVFGSKLASVTYETDLVVIKLR